MFLLQWPGKEKKEILKILAFIWDYFALKPNHSKTLLLFKNHTLI